MKLQEAKTLFNAQGMRSPEITPAPMADKWIIQAQVNRGIWQSENLIAKSGKVREFRTIEACLSVLSDIGLKKVTVHFK